MRKDPHPLAGDTPALCPKMAYFSRAAAKQSRKKHDRARRAYLCPTCGFWHMTSQDAGLRAQYKDIRSGETAA